MGQLDLEGAATTSATHGNPFSGQFFAIKTEPGGTCWAFNNHQKTSIEKRDMSKLLMPETRPVKY
jgi:hypothetical protein